MKYYSQGISYFMAREWVTREELRRMIDSPGKLKLSVIAVRSAWGIAWR